MKEYVLKIFNKEEYHWRVPLSVGIMIILYGLLLEKLDFNNFIQISIFVALLWYSFETRENNKLEQKPIVDLYYRPLANSNGEFFRLRNSGKGVAYNIQAEPVTINFDNNKYIFKFCIKDNNLMLAPLGDEKTINITCENILPNNSISILSDISALKLFENLLLAKKVSDLSGAEFIISFENANRKKIKRIFNLFYDDVNHIYRVNLEK